MEIGRKRRRYITKELNDLVISMSQSGTYTIAKICEVLQLGRKAVRTILQKHENGEMFISAADKHSKTSKSKNLVFTEIEQTMYNSIMRNNSFIQDELRDIVREQHSASISQATVSRKLKKMNICRKRLTLVPQELNSNERIEARATYASEVSRFSDQNLIFLDESGFNQHTRRSYGYSLVNIRAYITVPGNRNVNRSLICVIGVEGVIAYSYKLGAYNSLALLEFIKTKLAPYFEANPNKILIMDNARFHKGKEVLKLLRSKNIVFKFLTPYSPQLNPIEEFFSMVKSKFHALRVSNPEYNIETCLETILGPESNYSEVCEAFYRNMRKWLLKAQIKERFM